MKSILLTTTAIVAFAGAAAADGHTGVSFSGEATLGYNDDALGDNEDFYWDAELGVTFATELDNGITATATFDIPLFDSNLEVGLEATDFVIEIAAEDASLSFGDLDPVAEDRWGGVDGASVADFNDDGTHLDVTADGGVGFDAMLVGEATFNGITAALSYGADTDDSLNVAGVDSLDALQVYISGDFGAASFEVAYQGEVAGTPTIFGTAVSATLSGADLTVAYIDDETESSFGFAVAYPTGPVTLGGYYSVNGDVADNYGLTADYSAGAISASAFYDYLGNTETYEIGVEGSYDTGMNLELLAGYLAQEDGDFSQFYVAGVYDLGGGAELLVSYAEDEDDVDEDEIGDPEYQRGTTVEVSFSF